MPASQKVQLAGHWPWRPATELSPSWQGHGVAVKPKKKEAVGVGVEVNRDGRRIVWR